jgi:hypothetical protein
MICAVKHTPNPAGREGKPITLAGYSFEEAIQKALNTSPPKLESKPRKAAKKTARKK